MKYQAKTSMETSREQTGLAQDWETKLLRSIKKSRTGLRIFPTAFETFSRSVVFCFFAR